jgi:hypothetical protein
VHPLWMWVAVNLQGVAKARRAFDLRMRAQAAADSGLTGRGVLE